MPPNSTTAWSARAAVKSGAVTVRELTHHTSEILGELAETGETVIITRHGRVVAKLVPTTLKQLVQAQDPDRDLAKVEKDVRAAIESGQAQPLADQPD
jgi:prevent-host-death family protein